jgi:hypothetical protein
MNHRMRRNGLLDTVCACVTENKSFVIIHTTDHSEHCNSNYMRGGMLRVALNFTFLVI